MPMAAINGLTSMSATVDREHVFCQEEEVVATSIRYDTVKATAAPFCWKKGIRTTQRTTLDMAPITLAMVIRRTFFAEASTLAMPESKKLMATAGIRYLENRTGWGELWPIEQTDYLIGYYHSPDGYGEAQGEHVFHHLLLGKLGHLL